MREEPMINAFQPAKQALLDTTCLAHRTMGDSLSLVVDALATYIGGVPSTPAAMSKGVEALGVLLQ
jgi:hypothetical protein